MTNEEIKDGVLGLLVDLPSDLLYYNRKNDEDVTVAMVTTAIEERLVTVEDFIEGFKKSMIQAIKDNFGEEYAIYPNPKDNQIVDDKNCKYALQLIADPNKYLSRGNVYTYGEGLANARLYNTETMAKRVCTLFNGKNSTNPRYRYVKVEYKK